MKTDHGAMLAAIRNAIEDDLFNATAWEEKFLASVADLVSFELDLTDEQDKKLEEIWKRATQ